MVSFTCWLHNGFIDVVAVGVYDGEGPPVPIPNTVVKLIGAENTWLEAAWEDRSMPTQILISLF